MRNRCVFEQFFWGFLRRLLLFVALMWFSVNVITLFDSNFNIYGRFMGVAPYFSSLCKVYNVEFGKFAQRIFASFFAYFFFFKAFPHIFCRFLAFCAIHLRKQIAQIRPVT